jgi:class 3 adenylate cyclase
MQRIAVILRLEGPAFNDAVLEHLDFEVVIQRNGGMVTDEGENLKVLLFHRAKSAVTCAIELRRLDESASREHGTPSLLRSAVALGPVTISESRVDGDAVEIAANLATILTPGDIFVSGNCREVLADNLPVDYEPLGETAARGYRVLVDANEILSAIRHPDPIAPDWSWKVSVPIIAMLMFITLAWIWFNLPDVR